MNMHEDCKPVAYKTAIGAVGMMMHTPECLLYEWGLIENARLPKTAQPRRNMRVVRAPDGNAHPGRGTDSGALRPVPGQYL